MKNAMINDDEVLTQDVEAEATRGAGGALTLMRGLDVLDRVARGDNTLGKMARSLGLNKSTVHRLATTLVELKYLILSPRDGYSLGAKLLELGWAASQQITVTRIAHPHLLKLSADTGDTVNLGILDHHQVHYIDKIPGTRRIEVRCVIGERQPLRPTGLGKALLMDADEETLREVYLREARDQPHYRYDLLSWLELMRGYAAEGFALDLDENEDRIRCVAAPIRDMTGKITAAISVSSAQQYMDDARMLAMRGYVKDTALAISREFGYTGN
ncbi:IclR family transcriptional regulator [Asticcacaulis sp. EMRT-3]|uniref:IclR family transcriptional regulator n=1 Tax=Asticcacaulis sp. EMRT-3 TaxID=3040349 RepID=UPI0024AEAF51|nr:IclR family transcriptional regulator [Asticcacaulis sp. EMRT-3]MDI7773922.1 IclR family transcriptional regulator [Asticcacaulis sp. EMRT-3]